MKVLTGYKAAIEALDQRKPLEESAPPNVLARLAELFGAEISPADAVARILKDVREQGDRALLDYTERIDGVRLGSLEVSREEIEEAWKQVEPQVREALQTAAGRIRSFHEAHRPATHIDRKKGLGQIVIPLDRVGLYVPGGKAAYPSTVLMTAVPAKVAGVPEMIATTPPDREGRANPKVLAACRIAGADRVFKIGGAQAIAAMAYGTESVPKVDKICGPGNLFVVLAKRTVFGAVGIDGLHGPSEALIIADESADPGLCAADMLAQAEHDELATAILVSTSSVLLERVLSLMEDRLRTLETAPTIRTSLEHNGMMVKVDDLREAVDLANRVAPEHLSLMVEDPWALIPAVKHCGAVFLGAPSSAALGDYVAGPSHVMPTMGTARFTSPLRTEDFQKVTSIVAVTPDAARKLGKAGAVIARAEGLTAHAEALEARALPLSLEGEG